MVGGEVCHRDTLRELTDIVVGTSLEVRLVRKLCGQFRRQLRLLLRLVMPLLRIVLDIEKAGIAFGSDGDVAVGIPLLQNNRRFSVFVTIIDQGKFHILSILSIKKLRGEDGNSCKSYSGPAHAASCTAPWSEINFQLPTIKVLLVSAAEAPAPYKTYSDQYVMAFSRTSKPIRNCAAWKRTRGGTIDASNHWPHIQTIANRDTVSSIIRVHACEAAECGIPICTIPLLNTQFLVFNTKFIVFTHRKYASAREWSCLASGQVGTHRRRMPTAAAPLQTPSSCPLAAGNCSASCRGGRRCPWTRPGACA